MISQYYLIHIWRRILLLFCFLLNFSKKLEEKKKNEQTKVYDHGGQATRGQKLTVSSDLIPTTVAVESIVDLFDST